MAIRSEQTAQAVADALRPLAPLAYFIEQSAEGVVVVMLARDSQPAALPRSAGGGHRFEYRISRFSRQEAAEAQRQVTSQPHGLARFTCQYDPHTDAVQVAGYFPDPQVVDRMRSIPGVEVFTVPEDQAFRRLRSH
jgi:hypothetical protein